MLRVDEMHASGIEALLYLPMLLCDHANPIGTLFCCHTVSVAFLFVPQFPLPSCAWLQSLLPSCAVLQSPLPSCA